MRVNRPDRHLPTLHRGAPVAVTIDGRPAQAYLGETVAAVLLAEGIRVFSRDADGRPHGFNCGMGICYECAVTVDGAPNVRACVTPVAAGMAIETGARQ
ncbi:MAG: (2Fe-2S)-binding protein [Anaerolineae bacterium]|jgi:predicted molibdopterin-dependent oxidoreductase YjgC|nr:(2Fe-2S)-binding protein [Anaerolineae bacterium]